MYYRNDLKVWEKNVVVYQIYELLFNYFRLRENLLMLKVFFII